MEGVRDRPEMERGLWLPAVAVLLASWAVLSWAAPFTPVSSDATRDQLLVRDCVELGRCHSAGAPTSVAGIRQGAGWIDLLTLLRLLGLDVPGQRRASLFLTSVALATLFVAAGRLRRAAAWPTALLALLLIVSDGTAALLINTSLDFFPEVVGALALLLFATEKRRPLLLAAAVALGMAVNFHVAAAVLLPALLFVAARASARDLVTSSVFWLLTALSTSWDAWRMNVEELSRRHLLFPAVLALSLCAVLGVLSRRVEAPVALAWTMLIVPFGVGAAALVLAERHSFASSYLHPVLGPLCLLGGWSLDEVVRRASNHHDRIRRGVQVVLALLILSAASNARAFANDPSSETWTYADARLVAESLKAHGVSFSDATTRLQAPQCHDLVAAVGAYLPRVESGPPVDRSFFVALHGAGALSSVPSWLRWDRLRVCRSGAGIAEICQDAVPPVAGERVPPDRFLFSTRMDLATHRAARSPPFVARYEIGLEAISASRTVTVQDRGPEACRWRFTVVRGLDTADVMPSSHLLLTGPIGAKGSVVVEKPFGTTECPTPPVEALFVPCLKESER